MTRLGAEGAEIQVEERGTRGRERKASGSFLRGAAPKAPLHSEEALHGSSE